MKKFVALMVLFLAFALGLSAQDENIPKAIISGSVANHVTQENLAGITVELYCEGKLIETKTTGSNGKFKFTAVEIFKNYKVIFKGSNFVSRFVDFDLTNIPPENTYKKWDLELPMKLVERYPNIDFSTLEPRRSTIMKYNKSTGEIDYNMGEIETYRKELEKLLKKLEAEKEKKDQEKAAQEKKYNDAMVAAEAAMKANDYETAIKKYEEAKAANPAAVTEVEKKLEIAKTKYKEFQGAQALQKEYDEFMKAGDEKMKLKEYDNAIASYKQALTKKPNDAAANKKITEAEAAKKGEVDKTYNEALAKADKAYKEKDYGQAKTFFKEAKGIKPAETLPDQKIKEIDDLIKKDMENESKYNEAIANANKNLIANKFDDAITGFNEALKLRPGDAEATKGLDSAKKGKDAAAKDAADKAAKEKEFNDLVAKADKEYQAKNYDAAIKGYEEALKKFDNPDVKKKKFDAEAAYKKFQEEQAALDAANKKKAEYDKFMADGNSYLTAKDFDKAIASFESAKATGVNNVEADKKLTDAKNGKAAAEKDAQAKLDAEKKKADFEKFIADGDGKVSAQKFDEAVAAYTSALNLKIDDAAANKKIAEANAAKAAYEKAQKEKELADANAKKKAEFDAIIAAGDGKVSGQKFDDAIAEYKKALAMKVDDAAANAKIKEATDAKAVYDKEQADKAAADAANKKKAEFDGYITAGDGKVSGQKFEEAIAEYKKALALKVDDAAANAKIKEATDAKAAYDKEQADKAAADAANKKKAEFDGYITAGDGKVSGQKFDDAIAEYKKALALKVDDAAANAKIKEATDAKAAYDKEQADKAAADAANKKKAEFDAIITAGDGKLSGQKFEEAIAEYKKALALKVDDAAANAKITAATEAKAAYDKEQASKADAAQKKKLYDETIAKAQKDYDAGEFEAAIDKYNTALTYIPDDAFAKGQIEKAKAEIEKKKQFAEEQLTKLLQQADKDFDAGNFADAKGYYERYAKLHPENTHAVNRIKECEEKIKEKALNEATAKKKAEFDAIIAAGDSKLNNKEFDKAVEEYKKALATKFDDATANAKITAANEAKLAYEKELADKNAAENAAKKKAEFEGMIAAGDAKLTGQKFTEAIAEYTKALATKYDDATANAKITAANEAKAAYDKEQASKADAAQKKKLYDETIAKAQKDFDAGEFNAAIDKYNLALTYVPDDTFAKGQIEKAYAEIEKKKKFAEEQLAKLLEQADKDFDATKYVDAKGYYERYLKQRPDNTHAANRIKECEQKIKDSEADAAAKAKIEAQYKEFMAKGETAFKAKKYDEAIAAYDGALGVKSGDADATAKKEMAAKAKADAANALSMAAKKKEYDGIIAKANASFDAGDFKEAINQYNNALVVIPGDEFATKRIALCNERIENKKKEVEEMLAKLLKAADSEFDGKNYKEAKGYYERYVNQRPDNTYAKERIKECDAKILELANDEANKAKRDAQYKKFMEEGEKSAAAKNYDDAILQFTKALGVKEGDVPAQKRIDDMNKIKNDLFNMAKNQAAAKERESAYKAAIERGNAELSAGNFDPAIEAYRDALRAKENDKFATEQIKRCMKLNAEALAAKKKMYTDIIAKADQLFDAKNYVEAQGLYERAQKLNDTDPYPPQRIEECIKMINKMKKKDPNDYELVHSGTIVTGQGVLDGQRLLEEAKRQEKYEAEMEYVQINDKNQTMHKEFMKDDDKNALEQQDIYNKEEFEREQLFKESDKIRLYKVDSTHEYIDVRNEAYRGALHQDNQNAYNRQQQFNETAFYYDQLYEGKDEMREYKADSVKFYIDYRQDVYRQTMKTNDKNNYIKQANFNEEEFYTEQMFKGKDEMREYKSDSVKFYKDFRDDVYRQTIKNNDDKNYNKQAKYNDEEFYVEQMFKEKDEMREYKADSVKFYIDYRQDVYRQTMKTNDKNNYIKQANFNEEEFYTEQMFKGKDEMREYKSDSVKFYKDFRDDVYRQTMKTNDKNNYIKQANFNEEEFYVEQMFKDKDQMREYKADSVKFYIDYRQDVYRQTMKNNDDKNYHKQEQLNNEEFASEQMFKEKDEIRQESVKEVKQNEDNREAFMADVKKTNTDATTQNNDGFVRDEEKRYDFNKERSKEYMKGADEYKGINDLQNTYNTIYKKENAENTTENNEKLQNTTPAIPKNYDTGHLAKLAQDFGPGVHQWTTNKTDTKGKVYEIIVRRINVKGQTANDYMMVQNRWGVSYTKNGQTIGDHVWTVETAGVIIEHDK